MIDRISRVENRLVELEKNNRLLRTALITGLLVIAVGALAGWAQAQQQASGDVVRTRSLIIEDAEGRPRILLGSPIRDRQQTGNTRTGIIINDADGVERFGLGLNNAGSVIMGFDAPPGKGDDRNRERITIVADGNGGAYIRFLDRKTRVPARLFLDEDNRVWLEFNDAQEQQIVRRRFGFSGEQKLQEPR
jgi:hypothetical protein